MKKLIVVTAILFLSLSLHSLFADDLGELEELSDSSSGELSELGTEYVDEREKPVAEESKLSISFGGYLKALAYWNEERYSDSLWNDYYANYAAQGKEIPSDQQISGFNNIGTRMQFKVEAFLEDKARLFTAMNINYNAAGSLHDSTSDNNRTTSQVGDLRLIESFIEIYQDSRTWKVGSQIVTWGYLEGIEVPTDRVNARDHSYKSTEYEDSKLASTGILLTQRIFESTSLDILYIPIARTNIDMEFRDYFYPEEEEAVEKKPYNSKLATRFASSIGNLDYAISYVEGLDPEADLIPTNLILTGIDPITMELQYTVNFTGRKYNRIRSPGLDLQYNFGSLLAKTSYVQYLTEDEDGTDYFIKNNWSKYVIGAEFTMFGNTVNLYAGQHLIENFQEDYISNQTNFLMGQMRERTDFISGHINANFLTGDALNVVLLAAGYWDEEGEAVQTNFKATFKYKLANGLDLIYSPSYMELLKNVFVDHQLEVKYSF
ncbi:hypothetical protein KJ966_21620 [bacterium]|nr:hypothetical protein [bacterium]